jgi:ubiquinone/menaquinone biosynthesis C-methylase UbiE
LKDRSAEVSDWNRLYIEFPEVYEAWMDILHRPRPIDLVAARWPLEGRTVVDAGSGTGASTFGMCAFAAEVVGVEPNAAMRQRAERRAAALGLDNVCFVEGTASRLACTDGSADLVTCFATSFWPARRLIPAFIAECERVLHPDGFIVVLNTAPDWYGGEFHDLVHGDPSTNARSPTSLLKPASNIWTSKPCRSTGHRSAPSRRMGSSSGHG